MCSHPMTCSWIARQLLPQLWICVLLCKCCYFAILQWQRLSLLLAQELCNCSKLHSHFPTLPLSLQGLVLPLVQEALRGLSSWFSPRQMLRWHDSEP